MSERRRRADAESNDVRLWEAARVAIAELGASVTVDAIAVRAGVGVGTVYRRYPTKHALLQQVCLDAVDFVRLEAVNALADVREDAWSALERFARRCVDKRVGALASIAGSFVPADILDGAADEAYRSVAALVARVQRVGAIRSDMNGVDLLRLIAVHSRGRGPDGDSERALSISLDGLRPSGVRPLPGDPPTWSDERERWVRPDAPADLSLGP